LAVLAFLSTAKIASAWWLHRGGSWFDSNACTKNLFDWGFMKQLTAVSLFAGVGGFDLALSGGGK
jgi:hypothetical protein